MAGGGGRNMYLSRQPISNRPSGAIFPMRHRIIQLARTPCAATFRNNWRSYKISLRACACRFRAKRRFKPKGARDKVVRGEKSPGRSRKRGMRRNEREGYWAGNGNKKYLIEANDC